MSPGEQSRHILQKITLASQHLLRMSNADPLYISNGLLYSDEVYFFMAEKTNNDLNQIYRVLVIEDDEEVARLLCLSLEKAGLSCQKAADGLSALQLFQEQAPHLVLLDWMLPGMSGQEVLDAIRAQSDVPILVVSALADESSSLAFPGTNGQIGKPFNPTRLNQRVQEILQERYNI